MSRTKRHPLTGEVEHQEDPYGGASLNGAQAPEGSAERVRAHVHNIRRTLGRGAVRTVGRGYVVGAGAREQGAGAETWEAAG
jgi:hypothetical protein